MAEPVLVVHGVANRNQRDFERLVGREGLEGALEALHRSGVYLTIDELKGRRDASRGSARVTVDPAQLRNPSLQIHLTQQSSGSRGRRTAVPIPECGSPTVVQKIP